MRDRIVVNAMIDVCSRSTAERCLGRSVMGVLVGLVLLAGPQVVPAQAQGNTFTVNATGDESDLEPGDGFCLTTLEECTLRAAMEEANATANEGGPDVIEFDISGATPHVIQPGSALPQISEPVVINGTSEPDYGGSPVVEISGTNAGDAPGLDVAFSEVESGGGLTARGLAVVNFARAAFRFADDTGGNVVQGCYVGVRPDGTTAAGNNRGLFVSVFAPNTTIGGTETDEGNIISGNSSRGMDLTAAVTVRGNRIGVDANGDPMGNGNSGLFINADGATIGGTGFGEGNVIAHNGGDGVEIVDITPPNVQNVIRGNRIFANEGLGIDLEGGTEDSQGRTENDEDDADDGQNRLQNFPELQASGYDPDTEEMTVTYLVPSDPAIDAGGSSSYPLTIDFYVADADAEEGRAYLGTDTYSSVDPDDYGGCGAPPCAVTTTFTPQSSVERTDDVVATATDDNGNTSEFSPAVLVNFPPRFTDTGPFEVRETASEDDSVGDVDATDGEEGDTDQGVDYQIIGGNDPDDDGIDAFAINGGDGTITVANAGEIDFETREQFALQVEADDGTFTEEATVTINVTDVPPPSVTTDPATNVTADGARLNATVNPNGASTTVTFTYFPTSDPSSTTTVTGATELTGNSDRTVDASISGIDPDTQYGYTAEAASDEGTETGSEQTFATEAAPPEAATMEATGVTATEAQLNGEVDPNGLETTVEFEYYPSGEPDQVQTMAAQESPLTGNGTQDVSTQVSGLDPGTEYTFEILASNDAGSERSGEQTFATEAAPPEAATDAATNVTAQEAVLNGTVVPNGNSTDATFRYYQPADSATTTETVAAASGLTGTNEQSVSTSVGGLQPATEYAFRLRAENGGGDSAGSVRTFTTEPLEITIGQSADAPEQGSALDVTVSVPEGFVPTEQGLFYRQVGKQSFESTALEATGELSYEGTIPGTAVTERGLQYYVQLANEGFTTTVPDGGAEAPRYVPVRTPRMTAGVTLTPSQYQMISVPLRLDTTDALAQLRDDFGEIDRTEWRLLRWSSQAGEYEEVTTSENASGSGGGTLVPGRAYWLITRSGQPQEGRSSFDVGSGRSVPAAPIPIEVPPGWSQVANPRPYSVEWASVEGRASVMDPVAYAPSASDSTNFGVDVLGPWAGYWVFNPGESAVQLSVPPQEADVGASQMAEKSQASGQNALFGGESMFDARPTYALRLAARLERTEAPDLRDAQNVVGVADAGRPGAQTEDVAEPPPIGEDLRLTVVEETPGGRSVDLAGSLRPPSAEGQTWDLEVSASGAGDAPHTVRGRLQARGALPQGFEHRLMDRDTGRPLPIDADGAFTLQLTDERPVRHLRLIVGAEGFAEAESESIRPDRTGLRAVYPNPSRGPVSVDYHLKEGQRVKVQVYDLLGRTVKTLVSGEREAGHYTTRWNPTDVASGMYLVRLQTESTSATQRVSVVH